MTNKEKNYIFLGISIEKKWTRESYDAKFYYIFKENLLKLRLDFNKNIVDCGDWINWNLRLLKLVGIRERLRISS